VSDDRPAMTDDEPGPDPEKAAFLREIAEEVRGESSGSEHVAAFLYRVSDLYDPDEETSVEDIYVSVRNVFRIKDRGTLARDRS
jgi:hypothetical protein